MELQTTLHFVSHVGVVIALLSIFWSLRISDNKIEKLEAKDKDLNDVMLKMLEQSESDKGRQFVADTLIHYNRLRNEEFNDAVLIADQLMKGRGKLYSKGRNDE